MAIYTHSDERAEKQDGSAACLRRRGLIAGAAALIAGAVAKQTAEPVLAAGLVIDTDNASQSNTNIHGPGDFAPWSPASGFTLKPVLSVNNTTTNEGIAVKAPRYAIYGETTGGSIGVVGYATGSGTGVYGQSATSHGVNGLSMSGNGVYGQTSGTGAVAGGNFSGGSVCGVIGTTGSTATLVGGISGSAPAGGNGVIGQSSGSTASIGVYGRTDVGSGVRGFTTGNGYGVSGLTNGTGAVAGIYGTSPTAYGIIGTTTAAGYSGLTGTTATPGTAALGATATVPTAYAAFFTGTTVVNGNFAVTGSKSAAVLHPDGTHRLLYCVESPEAWFDDYGAGKLVGGKADVKLDGEFMALVHSEDYRVFLTPEGDCKGLYVTGKTASGFSVREQQGGSSSLTFSWRVVAKRKDNPGARLEKFTPIKLNTPHPDKLPKPEAQTK